MQRAQGRMNDKACSSTLHLFGGNLPNICGCGACPVAVLQHSLTCLALLLGIREGENAVMPPLCILCSLKITIPNESLLTAGRQVGYTDGMVNSPHWCIRKCTRSIWPCPTCNVRPPFFSPACARSCGVAWASFCARLGVLCNARFGAPCAGESEPAVLLRLRLVERQHKAFSA